MAPAHAIELPRELLDIIVEEINPLSSPTAFPGVNRSVGRFVRSLATLLAFSLVCRRWHTAAFPHIFKCLVLPPKRESALSDLILFLDANQHVAASVQALCLYTHLVNMQLLHEVIDSDMLPHLRYLVSDITWEYDSPLAWIGQPFRNPHTQTTLTRTRTLEWLKIDSGTMGVHSATIISDTIALLGRYAVIKVLELSEFISIWSVPNGTVIRMSLPRIEELKVKPKPSYAVALFRSIDVLSCLNLGCLSVRTTEFSDLECLNELLCLVGAKLAHLRLEIFWQWAPYIRAGPFSPRDQIVHALERGFASCTSLHGLQISVAINWIIKLTSFLTDLHMAEECWLIPLDLTSFIPKAGISRLEYLDYKICAWKWGWEFWFDLELSATAWERLREECRRTGGLKSVRVKMLGGRHTETFHNQVHTEMKEFEGVVRRGENSEYVCEEEHCRWSKSRREGDS